ncbi:cytochrome P450 [Trichoderma austrokoningii]
MSTIIDTGLLIHKLATLIASKGLALEATLLIVIFILAQVQWIRQATSYLLRRIQGLLYLLWGPDLIDRAYIKAQGKPFKVSTPANDHLLVTSMELIMELIEAPRHQLSLHAVAKELLQPKYTMHGFEWQDQRGVEGTGFVRALRSLLTSHLDKFQPHLERLIKNSLDIELKDIHSDGYSHVKLFPVMKRLVTKVNCFVFFGEELSQNAEFTAAALEFPQAVIFAAEFLGITPRFMRPLVASLVTNRHRAAKTLYRYLVPIVEQRLAMKHLQPQGVTPMDCMQWLIDTSPRKNPWTPARMVGEIMALWFGSVHQLAMTPTYAIQHLCSYPEYIEPLQEEVQRVFHADGLPKDVDKLPLLDSFIKESIRCNHSDAITCRRKALAPYTFQDGSTINRDDWVCIPQKAMLQDGTRYEDAHLFDGFRFARANAQLQQLKPCAQVPDQKASRLTHVSPDWPIWGLGNMSCPGRFYASLVIKLVLIRVLDDWECKMPDLEAPRIKTWRSSSVPQDDTIVMFRKK